MKPRLLGVLAFFNFVLMYGDNDEKQLALQSLVSLMQLMGPAHVTGCPSKNYGNSEAWHENGREQNGGTVLLRVELFRS